jgi:hypothetical protein
MVARDFLGWPFRAGVVVGALLATVGAGAVWLSDGSSALDDASAGPCAQAEAAPRAPVPSIMAIYRPGGVRFDGEEVSREELIARLGAKVKLAELGGVYRRFPYQPDQKLYFHYLWPDKPLGSHPYHLIR